MLNTSQHVAPLLPSMSDGSTAPDTSIFSWIEPAPTAEQFDPPASTTGLTLVLCTYQRPASLKRFLDSLVLQFYQPAQLVIVDASPTDETERMLRDYPDRPRLASRLLYFRVSAAHKGLTRQRNFALQWVATDLVAFFDDDIVLLPHCLREMEKLHRLFNDQIGGVGAFMENQSRPLNTLIIWRLRFFLRIIPDLRPGRYHRSGMSTPWSLAPTEDIIEGDWLPGCAMMWKTAAVRETGFYERFEGYAHGEDLEFSLRARKGRLVMAGAARVLHMYEPSGRPDPFSHGYMVIYNKYQIHLRALPDRTWRDTAWFIYAWIVDTLLLVRHVFVREKRKYLFRHIGGRLKAAFDIARRNWRGIPFDSGLDELAPQPAWLPSAELSPATTRPTSSHSGTDGAGHPRY